jgi:excisionase family DNA binding protein
LRFSLALQVAEGSNRAEASSERWVSIRRAAEILGVNQATLRQWGDAGQLRTFTTPGGHRRFFEADLQALVDRGPTAARRSVPEVLLGIRERYEALARRCLSENRWFQSFDEPARRRFRILGSSMLNLISAYLMGGRRERARTLLEGRDVAAEYGAEAARLGLSLPEATEAFLLFRTPVLDGLSRWVRERQSSARESDDVLRRANYFMDQVLLTMAAAHEAARSAVRTGAQT